MTAASEPLSASTLAIMYGGDVVFAMSGALAAGRRRMDIVGFALIGTITGIGGGTLRDLLLGRPVWWTQQPLELVLCVVVSVITFFAVPKHVARQAWVAWSDALGLAAFSIVGCHVALDAGTPPIVAVFMGMLTGTGGGVVRDILTGSKPMITDGQVYATAALLGATCYAFATHLPVGEPVAEALAFFTCFCLRAIAIIFDVRLGPPGEFIRASRGKVPSRTSS